MFAVARKPGYFHNFVIAHARPYFASENLRWNGPWLIYRLPKTTHTGKTFIQLDPLEFIDKIAAFIPPPRRHRHHYHGAFAPNAPIRGVIATSAIQTPKVLVPPGLQQTAMKWLKFLSLGQNLLPEFMKSILFFVRVGRK